MSHRLPHLRSAPHEVQAVSRRIMCECVQPLVRDGLHVRGSANAAQHARRFCTSRPGSWCLYVGQSVGDMGRRWLRRSALGFGVKCSASEFGLLSLGLLCGPPVGW